ncbi:MAG: CopG family transcriptional regulator [Actinomycetota bacterium]|jgi:hypothetical protein|nr:CopG family transcriptional regulator [Actinomycetota bacterium]
MRKKIDEVLAEDGAAAENYGLSGDLPERVEVNRPNLGRTTVVSLRLSADEHERLQRAATEVNLPISTLIRVWALDRLRADGEGEGGSVTERLSRLERAVFQRPA